MEPRPSISHRYRVRFDEADAEGRLRPSGLLRYAQDMAWRHSEEAGFGRDWYDARAMHWIVRNIQLRVHAAVLYGDELDIATEIIGTRRMWARRHAEVQRGETLVATVDTDWVLLRDDGRPAVVPEEIARYFSPAAGFERERVTLPDPIGDVTHLATRVRPVDLDPLRHMNNAAYLDMVDDGIARMPSHQRVERPDLYRVGYVLPALPETSIDISCWTAGEREVACRISDGEGNELTKVLVSRSGG